MAYKDSGALSIGQSYQLGAYTFSITVTPDPGEGTTGINVRCDKGDERARVASEVSGTVQSWSVEANETEASVYVKTDFNKLDTGDVPVPVPTSPTMSDGPYIYGSDTRTLTATWTVNGGVGVGEIVSGTRKDHLMASESAGSTWSWTDSLGQTSSGSLSSSFTYQGKTVYYHMAVGTGFRSVSSVTPSTTGDLAGHAGAVAWTMIYGVPDKDSSDKLIARFAIDIREAGGGPDGDWDEPGDTGDLSYTLNVNVTGASAGTHDAAAVPVAPADQPVYGSGGAGGNGGGGGAGQSTAIVRRFATSRAGSVNQEVTLRPPGVGGKGSPGGKGGDGCILIFY